MDPIHEETALGKVYDSRLMMRLLNYLKPYQWQMLLCIVLMGMITAAELAGPYLIKVAIDEHINGDQDVQALLRIALIYFGLLLTAFLFGYWQMYLMQSTGKRVIYNMRQEVFSHLQAQSLAFFDRNPAGRLVTRVMNDTEALNELYSMALVTLVKDVFILFGIMLAMILLNVRLALFSFTLLPLIVLATWVYRRYAREAYRKVRILLAEINSQLSENIAGMRIVQIFHREKQQYDKFKEVNQHHFEAGLRELRAAALFRPSMDLLYALGLATLVWFGSGQVLAGIIEFGVLYAFIDYINRFFQPIHDMSEKFTILQAAMAASERIFQLLDTYEEIPDPAHPVKIGRLQGSIQFEHVWYAYQGEDWILKDVSFRVEPGETVAIVGATGAGKSSIINLLSRFYDVQKGRITIDGIDIREMKKEDLRRNLGVVLQDVFLFSGDILSNIRLNSGASESEVQSVARQVGADDFIQNLPQKYREPVMERGATLSAGEQQLLAFARTLLFNPAILILDEATANIDTETEQLIQKALHEVTENRTTLVVAHRLSTIQHADNIIVLHQGEIREEGTHQELLAKEGLYYKLYQLQYKEELYRTGDGPTDQSGTFKKTEKDPHLSSA